MKKIPMYFLSLVVFAINFICLMALIRGVDPNVLFSEYFNSAVSFILFSGKMIFLHAFFVYLLYRISSERKIRQCVTGLPIPVKITRILPLPGFRLPFFCHDGNCRGALIYTMVCESHSLAGVDGKVFFPRSSNWCKINIGLLAQYRQILGGQDRLFCADCGTEYDWRMIQPAKNPLNLYNILPR